MKRTFAAALLVQGLTFAALPAHLQAAQEECEIKNVPTYSVVSKSIREKGMVGELFSPVECKSASPNLILVLGGSEGGIPVPSARALAQHGMTALALGYFAVPGEGLPKIIDQIPLEYFENALSQARELVPNAKCCSLIGMSKGAEGGLAFASLVRPDLLGLVLVSGTDSAFEGFESSGGGRSTGNSGWSYQGKDIDFTPYVIPDSKLKKDMYPQGQSYPPVLKPYYDATIALPTGIRGVLPIEQAKSPILMLSGEEDQMYNSTAMSDRAVQRAKLNGFKHSIEHVSFPGVGHFVIFGEFLLPKNPYFPTQFGGTVEASRINEPLAWSKIMTFLKEVHQ